MKTIQDIKHQPTREIIELIEVWQKVDNDFEFQIKLTFEENSLLITFEWHYHRSGFLNKHGLSYQIDYQTGLHEPTSFSSVFLQTPDTLKDLIEPEFERRLKKEPNSYISKNNLQSIFYYSNNNLDLDFPNTSNGFIYGLHRIVDGKSKNVVSEPRMTECAAMIDLAIKVHEDG